MFRRSGRSRTPDAGKQTQENRYVADIESVVARIARIPEKSVLRVIVIP